MPMFQPSKRDGVVVAGDGQVLDLDTAVKDGVLGGVGGGVIGAAVGEKLDLKKMIEELDLPEIPSVFICPISLEPMQDPVTLCTGQTYERSNILKWFNLGHYTCPTTMQELWDDSITPNRTLYHLIYTWFSQKYSLMKKKSEDVQGRVSELIQTLKKAKGQARIQALKELKQVVAAHATAMKTVVDEESKTNLMQPTKISLMIDMLNEGSVETKINCTRLIEKLMEEKEFRSESISSHGLLVGLMRLVKDKRHSNGILPGLSLLRSICLHKQVMSLVVRIGAVPQLVELLPVLEPDCLELALFILNTLSSLPEGKEALKDCGNTIPHMVRLLMRVSESCTQYALSILWSVCKLAPEECSSVAVEAGLAAKLLLVIQSGCNPVLKQKSSELLKLCSLNYTDTIFISKCKLTRTIQ
ncbi:hypothetical protein like AT5G65920 [Hibiscus trionum]|uniref:U-box domain-containing protein n=1 Tax=Hibiscus trionum TaxID=183268 RepID=A0A9W7J7H4_HIBTR|nr:hypothetical protein like AT5G65920 [Hibiscus trionum]